MSVYTAFEKAGPECRVLSRKEEYAGEDYQSQDSGCQRGNPGAEQSQFRTSEFAENQTPVPEYVEYIPCQEYPHGGECIRDSVSELFECVEQGFPLKI